METIKKVQEELHEYVLSQVHNQKEIVASFVHQQQENLIEERLKAKEQLEFIMAENNKLIAAQQERLAELTHSTEAERLKEFERVKHEQEEQKRREDEARLLEIKRKVALEQQREAILNKNKSRSAVSFSLIQ
eukprot:TRINITY_DN621_c0_g1_i1.p1 TRINITY_DN621_c0_g1~~TRINITY_DN621_c0_g1_i1.p1  ORF type:complete len:133 (+),score=43.76 TRINITY_DN621_c0_g1_i1:637-1035(+)